MTVSCQLSEMSRLEYTTANPTGFGRVEHTRCTATNRPVVLAASRVIETGLQITARVYASREIPNC
jgi:hypothetical protein